jgi:peptidoglycan/LPS O-acetylase OafA/YrhL
MKIFNSRYFNLNFSDLSTYRTQLMGVAALLIIVCHMNIYRVLMPQILAHICCYGMWGVDMFLFLSGLGLYYSLSKKNLNNKNDYLSFYKKRFYRIFVPYFMIYIPYCLIFTLLEQYSIKESILCLTTLEFWLFHRGAWFISLIIILYLISPFLYKLLSKQHKWIFTIGIIAVIAVLRSITLENTAPTSVLYNVQLALGRVPSFILGLTIGSYCKEGKQISTPYTLLILCISISASKIFNVWDYPWLITPTLLYISLFIITLLKGSWIDKCLTFVGKMSLESYLTHITLIDILKVLIPAYIYSPIFYGKYLEYAIIIVVGLLLAYYVHNAAKKILSKILGSTL